MPGGLTRVAASHDARAVAVCTRRRDQGHLGPVGGAGRQLHPARLAAQLCQAEASGKDLPSRAADNLFWLGRYAERTEDIMRVLRSVVRRLTDDAAPVERLRRDCARSSASF